VSKAELLTAVPGEPDELDALFEGCGGRITISNPDILTMDMSSDDMKFSNSDLDLDGIIKRNGGRLTMSNADTLLSASW